MWLLSHTRHCMTHDADEKVSVTKMFETEITMILISVTIICVVF